MWPTDVLACPRCRVPLPLGGERRQNRAGHTPDPAQAGRAERTGVPRMADQIVETPGGVDAEKSPGPSAPAKRVGPIMNTLPSGFGAAVYRFGDYELDRRTLELRKSGEKVRLALQPTRLLALLASRAGELVARDELRRELWAKRRSSTSSAT